MPLPSYTPINPAEFQDDEAVKENVQKQLRDNAETMRVQVATGVLDPDFQPSNWWTTVLPPDWRRIWGGSVVIPDLKPWASSLGAFAPVLRMYWTIESQDGAFPARPTLIRVSSIDDPAVVVSLPTLPANSSGPYEFSFSTLGIGRGFQRWQLEGLPDHPEGGYDIRAYPSRTRSWIYEF